GDYLLFVAVLAADLDLADGVAQRVGKDHVRSDRRVVGSRCFVGDLVSGKNVLCGVELIDAAQRSEFGKELPAAVHVERGRRTVEIGLKLVFPKLLRVRVGKRVVQERDAYLVVAPTRDAVGL